MPEFEVPATSLLHLRAEFDEQSLYAKLDGDGLSPSFSAGWR